MENINKTVKMMIFEWISLAAVVVACFLFQHNQINNLDQKLERQGTRTDRLYEMFIDLLKENRR